MVLKALKQLTSGPIPVILVFALLFASLSMMSGAVQNSATFGRLYSLLLVINILALLLLVALILRNVVNLIAQYRRRAAGSLLTVRLVVMFILLSMAPVSLVYYFAIQFLHRGIDSWFDLRVEHALEDALELGSKSLDGRMRELVRSMNLSAEEVARVPDSRLPLLIDDMRTRSEASEMTLVTLDNKVIYSSSNTPTEIVPALPGNHVFMQLAMGHDYAALEPLHEAGLHFRIAVATRTSKPTIKDRVLHALFPLDTRIGELADNVQSAFAQYKELVFLRQPLKYSFTLTLSLVLLLSLLAAVWAAFFSARRLAAPISDLAEGTRAVAAGDYDKRLPLPGRDDLGVLVRSFNEMTHRIALARDEASRSKIQVEEQRAYLETVLGNLSTGVLSFDADGQIQTANNAALQILDLDIAPDTPITLARLGEAYPQLAPFVDTVSAYLRSTTSDWHSEIVLFGSGGRRMLICRGSVLPASEQGSGHVIVFDDMTTLIQAQRNAAWGEVARRLAHEIKNPLTPIQLSAERLRHKYLHTLPAEDAEILDRSTHTIVQQVNTMKEMVRTFSDYARPPQIHPVPINLGHLINETLDLYRGVPNTRFILDVKATLPTLRADAGRLRQLLHNLIKNALESTEGRANEITISGHCVGKGQECNYIKVSVRDRGPGIPVELLDQLFEPYTTSKPRGTGLGLAIVKKIVEEHSGMIWAENLVDGGALIGFRLPVVARSEEGLEEYDESA